MVRKEIEKRFEDNIPLKEIVNWLKTLGPENELAIDTVRKYRKRYEQNKFADTENKKLTDKLGSVTDIEQFLLETITQCRSRKASLTISGKDFQYYDQQMQNAIKLLQEMRSSGDTGLSIEEVMSRLGEKVLKENESDEGTVTEKNDNSVS